MGSSFELRASGQHGTQRFTTGCSTNDEVTELVSVASTPECSFKVGGRLLIVAETRNGYHTSCHGGGSIKSRSTCCVAPAKSSVNRDVRVRHGPRRLVILDGVRFGGNKARLVPFSVRKDSGDVTCGNINLKVVRVQEHMWRCQD